MYQNKTTKFMIFKFYSTKSDSKDSKKLTENARINF